MKHLSAVGIVSLLALVGCENSSRLDKTTKPVPTAEAPGATPPGPTKVDRAGTLEERVARLEDTLAKNAEALDFLNKVYAQQKAQQQAQQREEAAPDAMFAVDISQNVKAGLVEGSPQALVTIVEAWDFA